MYNRTGYKGRKFTVKEETAANISVPHKDSKPYPVSLDFSIILFSGFLQLPLSDVAFVDDLTLTITTNKKNAREEHTTHSFTAKVSRYLTTGKSWQVIAAKT